MLTEEIVAKVFLVTAVYNDSFAPHLRSLRERRVRVLQVVYQKIMVSWCAVLFLDISSCYFKTVHLFENILH